MEVDSPFGTPDVEDDDPHVADSLRFQLCRQKTSEDMATRLAQLAEHRLAILGTEYLLWEQSERPVSLFVRVPAYNSIRIVLLSVEPLGTQSRRVRVSLGREPPTVATGESTVIYVNHVKLVADEGERYTPWSPAPGAAI
jgi:hypothetical protein